MVRLVCLFLLWLLAATPCTAAVSLMPIRDLRPGMVGVGKTVIAGDRIEDFAVEIIGVSGSPVAGYSILAKASGPLIEKAGGVAQGMSGSPVYIDGRLVGAVAFGRAFNDPHYCSLTPISNMLRLLDSPRGQAGKDWPPADRQLPPEPLLPKGTALLAGGFAGYGLDYLRERLAPLGLEVLAAGGGSDGAYSGSETSLQPGSSLAVSIMDGDLNLGALGTVTWVDEAGRLLAFGHPFMQNGDSDFFLNRVWILGCIPNLSSSYKVGNIGPCLGRISQDRASGVAGSLGQQPQSVPVYISVRDQNRSQDSQCRVRIVQDEKVLPAALDAAVVNLAAKTVDRNGGGTAKVAFTIQGKAAQGKTAQALSLQRDNMFYAGNELFKGMEQELSETVNVLLSNKLAKVEVAAISVAVDVYQEPRVAEILRVKPRQDRARPGQEVVLDVVLKPYRGQELGETVTFTVPKDYPGEKLALTVRGGSSMAWAQQLLRKQQEEGLPAAEKKEVGKTLQDFVKEVQEADKNNQIIVDVAPAPLKEEAASQPGGGELGLRGLLAGSPYKSKQAFDFIVDGEAQTQISIQRGK